MMIAKEEEMSSLQTWRTGDAVSVRLVNLKVTRSDTGVMLQQYNLIPPNRKRFAICYLVNFSIQLQNLSLKFHKIGLVLRRV